MNIQNLFNTPINNPTRPKDSRYHVKGKRNVTPKRPKLTKMKRNIKATNLYKENFKKFHYLRKLDKQNFKKTWDTVKEVIGKTKLFRNAILKKVDIDENGIFDQNKIANEFNKPFTEIRLTLASSIPTSSEDFKPLMNVSETVLREYTRR